MKNEPLNSPNRPFTVLIADDAPLIRARLAKMLQRLPAIGSVLQSHDVAETLATIRDRKPDVVLLDLFMPGGSGLDVLREIAGDPVRPRVIVLTTSEDEALRERCLADGAEFFFEKGSGFIDAVDTLNAMAAAPARAMPCTPRSPDATSTPQRSRTPLRPEPAGTEPFTVLIVEDHDFQRDVLARMAHALGATEVLTAADGAQALDLLRGHPRDVQLILSDLDMPNMDGMEFVRHLGRSGTSAALAIISTHDPAILNSVQTMCQAYGIVPLGILAKPVANDGLAALMASARAPRKASSAPPSGARHEFSLEQIREGMRRGQFEPFFQPKVELANGRIVGAEALARWRHPQAGIVSPFAFIETLEQSGSVDELTFLMLAQSAAACRGWRARGLELEVSVNLSLTSLGDTGLADRIAATVAKTGLDPRHMTLEITETAAMTNVAAALENLARLRIRGFGLSIDDFGTGFSSMQQLGRVAFTELKIDRGFVAAMAEKREARAIVESSIDMAKRLGITSIAEGVETQAERDALAAAGCDLMQGYFVSKPVTEREFAVLCAGRPQ